MTTRPLARGYRLSMTTTSLPSARRAARQGKFQVLRRRDRGDDARTHRASWFYRGQADATGRAEHEQ